MVFQSQKTFMAILDNLVTENRTTWDPDQPPRNLADAFLAEIQKVIDSSKRYNQGLLPKVL
jgi:cytochrome P450 family 2 subfamily D